MDSARRFLFRCISETSKTKASRAVNNGLLALILLNSAGVLASTFSGLPTGLVAALGVLELISVLLFTVEYMLRVWTASELRPDLPPAKARLRYVVSFLAIVDLISILPFYIPFAIPIDLRILRLLRLVRMMRLLKLHRYSSSLQMMGTVLRKKASSIITVLIVMLLLLLISATIMYGIESAAQPDKFQNIGAGLWWAVATLTTVGYGDIYPVTGLGKLFSALIAVLGIGLVALPTSLLSAGFLEELSQKREATEENLTQWTYCPHCGKPLQGAKPHR